LASYGEALKQTRSQQVPLLIVLDDPASEEDRLEQIQTMSDDPSHAKLLGNYKLCRVNVSTDYGKKVAGAFQVAKFPHTVVIDRTGTWQLFKKTGRISTQEWVATLETHKEGNRESSSGFSSRFSQGGRACVT
ncbi:MAG: hypothetical protein N2C14_04045, partial [Planctomycetales bacterium]